MNRTPITLLVCLSLLAAAAAPAGADILYLNAGEEHVGTLKSIDNGRIGFTEIGGRELSHPASEVAHLLISRVRPGDEHTRVADLTDPIAVAVMKRLPEAEQFPDSDFVTLYRNRTFAWQADGSVVYDRRVILRIFKEPGLEAANMERYFQADRETFELVFAHTYAPDGHVYHLTDDALSEEAIYSSTPEYDRQRKVKFALKKVDIGSVVDVAMRITTKPPTALFPYLVDTAFGEREPVLHEECVVSFPETMDMAVENLHWDTPNLPVLKESRDPAAKRKVLTWTFRDPKGYIPEQNMPSTSRVFPRVWVYPRRDWKSIGAEFTAALAKAAPTPALLDGFLKETGAAAGGTAAEKTRLVYEAILKKIRLLPLSIYDMGGVEPLPVDVALQKRYGSNLARVHLMHCALAKLGVPSQIGFVSYWGADEIRMESPNLGQAAYGVLRVELDGRPFYTTLDSDYLPFGHLPTGFQGSRAIFLRDGTFTGETLPEGGPADNQVWRSVFARLGEDGGLEVTEIRRPRGPAEASLRTLRAAKAQEKVNFAQKTIKRVHPKAEMLGFSLSDLDDMQAPAVLTLRYRIPDAAIRAADHLLAFKNLWVNYDASSASLASRTWPMEYWATEENVNTVLVEVPAGFRWVPWNRDYVWDCGCLSYRSSLSQNGTTLQFADRYAVHRKVFPPDETYQHFRRCLQEMSNLTKQWIILEKEPAGKGVTGGAAPGARATEAPGPARPANNSQAHDTPADSTPADGAPADPSGAREDAGSTGPGD